MYILGADQKTLEQWLLSVEAKKYSAIQIMDWLHKKQELDPDKMSNLSCNLRTTLKNVANFSLPEIVQEEIADDGTCKWLLSVPEKNLIEMVFIPEARRGTLCISSQVGCMLNCTFCYTARQGFSRNLDVHEIIGQLWLAKKRLQQINNPLIPFAKITNVVFMGMGEPLLNLSAVVSSINIMLNQHAYGLAKKRITISTSGVIPGIESLQELGPIALALSLHAPTNELRNKLVPINRKYPLEKLIPACQNFSKKHQIRILIEYVMLNNINDTIMHAKQLVKLVSNLNCMINLIPFNPFKGTQFTASSNATILEFKNFLINHGFVVTIRKTRGQKISAACGQLAGKVLSYKQTRCEFIERNESLAIQGDKTWKD